MLSCKPKQKFDKYKIRGMIYAGISMLGIGYELLFSKETRVLLILAYAIVIAFGIFYIWYLRPPERH